MSESSKSDNSNPCQDQNLDENDPDLEAAHKERKSVKQEELDLEDYRAYKLAESVKKRVIAYFGILGLLVSLVISLFGIDRIQSVIENRYTKQIDDQREKAEQKIEALSKGFETRLANKDQEANARLNKLTKDFESKLLALEARVAKRADEAHSIIGGAISQALSKQMEFDDLDIDLSAEIGSILDQGQEGTTIGFVLAYCLQAELKAASGESISVSPRSIYQEAQRWDEWAGEDYSGSSLSGGLKGLANVGAYSESDWPYLSSEPFDGTSPQYLISGYTLVQNEPIDFVLGSLQQGKTVAITANITNAFFSDRVKPDGKVTLEANPTVFGGHGLCLVGYTAETKTFKFANSWGVSWGERGFGYITRDDLEKIIKDAATLNL